jgi:trimethylamine--corrinoid protein Co-methyltransferase
MERTGLIPSTLPRLDALTERQIEELHLAALEVLRRTGVEFQHGGAVDLLKEAGAFVYDGNLVKFPAAMVEDAIASAPSRIVMCDRDGEAAMYLEGTRVYFGTGSDCLNVIDPETGEHRRFTKADLIDGYRLVDALPNIDFVMSMGIPSDVEVGLQYDTQMALMLEHTTKPKVFVTNDGASCQRAIDMAAALAGGYDALAERPHILLYSEPTSPLQHSRTAVEKVLLMAKCKLPFLYAVGILMGGTGPITMAGGLVLSLAEILSGLVLHQTRSPGSPFVFGSGVFHMDMRAAQICYGSPELHLTNTAMAQVGRWYGMPTWGFAGCSDSKVLDEQAALEALFSVLVAQLSGPNLAHDVGYLESGLTTSFEMVVLSDELIAMTDQLMRGIEVSEDTLLVEEIDRVGPGGHYMKTAETVKRFRDYWFPSLLSRKTRERWLEAGGLTLGQRLSERVKEIIAEHEPQPLDRAKKERIQEILGAAIG